MSEYWKSVPRKFCDFCKCWITDNKPSVEFHERGKRHQENVQLRLKEVRKKSLQNSMEEEEMKREMDAMEKAALEAFKKDLKDNPELAAKYGVSLEPKPQESSKKSDNKDTVSSSETSVTEDNKSEAPKIKEWFEAATPEGYHYYWSTVTGESQWEAPEEYLSLEEQEATKQKSEEISGSGKETSDSTKETSTVASKETKPVTRVDPSHSRSAYGAWDVVKEIEKPKMYDESSAPPALDEIPLPQDERESEPKPKKPKFQEKTVTSLGPPSSGPVAFKKRKIAAGARNVRQKNDDD